MIGSARQCVRQYEVDGELQDAVTLADGKLTGEERRLEEVRTRAQHWRRWGPYLSERQWGTVREDYSAGGTAWEYLPHDHARSRAYRWGEDGIAGISDNHQRLCFAVALWNGEDPILKERLFGLTGNEGNHGEDVKECYFYLDNTPTHSYMLYLYKYPHNAYPYARLVEENRRRTKAEPEFELLDTGVFADGRYFDVFVEYAKAGPDDVCVRITAHNRGPSKRALTVLPTLWFRNTWSWTPGSDKPEMHALPKRAGAAVVETSQATLGTRWLYCEAPDELIFTKNETNKERLFGVPNDSPYVKDAFHEYVVRGRKEAIDTGRRGTKCAARFLREVAGGRATVIRLRLCDSADVSKPFDDFDEVFARCRREADEFYARVTPFPMSDEMRSVQRQAFAGMLWSKQFYHYVVEEWLDGDPAGPPPPPQRESARNSHWRHLYTDDILSMPDKWEYPWFAAWDLAFHTISLAMIDPEFAKRQLVLLTREWYMHPNGQLPAYEWAFDDVNPPVHAWAALRVYKIEKKMYGRADKHFLERVFQKLLLNFTWWLNRKDADENDVFQGGFLGLDNIGIFDRSAELPTGGHIDQADGTSWMAVYCLNMLAIALELALDNPAYEDIASKFFEHFLHIANAMNHIGKDDVGLWDPIDGFYYDVLHLPDGSHQPLRVRSLVGLIPVLAVETLEPRVVERLPGFEKRMRWFIEHRTDLAANVACLETEGAEARRLLAVANRERLARVLTRMLDPASFLSPWGVRSLSKEHESEPYVLRVNGDEHRVAYEPGESQSGLFGGNSNWRGPVWFPVNYLIIEALQKFHHYYGDEFRVECPTGSGKHMTLWQVAAELSDRLIGLFARDAEGKRAVCGSLEVLQDDPQLFYEYFNGDTGAGMGASHQTGWTGLVAKLIQQRVEHGGRRWVLQPSLHKLEPERIPS